MPARPAISFSGSLIRTRSTNFLIIAHTFLLACLSSASYSMLHAFISVFSGQNLAQSHKTVRRSCLHLCCSLDFTVANSRWWEGINIISLPVVLATLPDFGTAFYYALPLNRKNKSNWGLSLFGKVCFSISCHISPHSPALFLCQPLLQTLHKSLTGLTQYV